jgi:nucleoside-diphosphate-sugar epimerase
VEWVAEDVFNLPAWQKYLEECQAVIHAITIILEKPQAGLTYDRVITGSTKLAADAANETGTSKFVYLSLQEKPPFISKTFLEAKRQAETCLVGRCFKSVILRPALVYGKARPPTVLAASIMKLVSRVAPGRAKNSIPLAAEAVAKVAVKAALDPQMEGVLDVAAIQHISQEM